MKININGGESKKLLTGGKYCPEDILVTAEGGGEAAVQRMKRFVLDLSEVTAAAGTLAPSFWPGKTFYGTVNNSSATWQGFEGKTVQSQYSASEAVGRYMTDEIKNNTVIYVTGYTSTVLNIQRIDLGSLASAPKSCLEDYEGELPPGTYEFAEGQIYYYTYGESSAPRAKTEKDVNFYDYDGTLLYSYTLSQIQNLSQLPPLPTRAGLICQEWNWTLDDLKEYGKRMNVGANYITDDGKTRLYIHLSSDAHLNVPLLFSQSAANGVTIDWGDGSGPQKSATRWENTLIHTYPSIGDYVITLEVTSGALDLGYGYHYYSIVGGSSSADGAYKNQYYKNTLIKVEIGNGVTQINGRAFYNCMKLKSVTVPQGIPLNGDNNFNMCSSLKFIVCQTASTAKTGVFADCANMRRVSFNKNAYIGNDYFAYCYTLDNVWISHSPDGTGFGSGTFFDNGGVKNEIEIPTIQTAIGSGFCRKNRGISVFTFPPSITSIGASAFQDCFGTAKYDFTQLTAVPTLSNTNVFTGIPSDCIIVVPDSLVAQWKTATNWSAYASYIKGASEL